MHNNSNSNSNNNPLISTAIYVRVSKFDQVEKAGDIKASLDLQEKSCRAVAASQGWQVSGIYREEGISGEEFDARPALQKLITEAAEGKFQAVMITVGDRLARDQFVYFQAVEVLEKQYAIQIYNLAQPVPMVDQARFKPRHNPNRVIQHGLAAMMAAFDQARRVEWLQAAREEEAKKGRFMACVIPYGYKQGWRQVGSKMIRIPIPDPDTYWVLELLPKLLIEEKLSMGQLLKRLDALGAPHPSNGNNTSYTRDGQTRPDRTQAWDRNRVSYILKNPFYNGYTRHKAYKVGSDGRQRANPDKNEIILSAHDYGYPWDNDTWQSIQLELKRRAQRPKRESTSANPLSGIIRCGYCGYSMAYSNVLERATNYFVCSGYYRRPNSCQSNRTPIHLLLEDVYYHFDERLASFRHDPASFYTALNASEDETQREALNRKLEKARQQLQDLPNQRKRLRDALKAGAFDGEGGAVEYRAMLTEIETNQHDLTKTISQVEKDLETINHHTKNVRLRVAMLEGWEKIKQEIQEAGPLPRQWPESLQIKVRATFQANLELLAVKSKIKSHKQGWEISTEYKWR